MKEQDIQNRLADLLITKGYLAVRLNSGMFRVGKRFIRAYIIKNTGKSTGMPDLIAFKNGDYLMIEVKKPKGVVSDSQKDFYGLVESFGLKYYIVESIEEMEVILG